MGKGRDKKKRARRKMTPAEHSKRQRTASIATIFKGASDEDDEVAPTAPDAQRDNASKDVSIEQASESGDTGGDEGGQKVGVVLRESVPQPSSNKSKGEELQIHPPNSNSTQPPNSIQTSTAITIEDQRFSLKL